MKKSTQLVWLIIFVIALILVLVNAFTGLFPEPVSQLFSLAVNILLPVWTFWAWRTTGIRLLKPFETARHAARRCHAPSPAGNSGTCPQEASDGRKGPACGD